MKNKQTPASFSLYAARRFSHTLTRIKKKLENKDGLDAEQELRGLQSLFNENWQYLSGITLVKAYELFAIIAKKNPLALVQISESSLFHKTLTKLQTKTNTIPPASIPYLLKVSADFYYRNDEMFERWDVIVKKNLLSYTDENLMVMLYTYAQLGYFNETLYTHVKKQIYSGKNADISFFSKFLWVYSSFELDVKQGGKEFLLDKVVEYLQNASFIPGGDYRTLGWSLANMNEIDSEAMSLWMYGAQTRFDLSQDECLGILRIIDDACTLKTFTLSKETEDALARHISTLKQPTPSVFAREVIASLEKLGFHTFPEEQVGMRFVDCVVHLDSQPIAIECDGHRFHRNKNRLKDMVLRKKGYSVIHVCDLDFKDAENKEQFLKNLLFGGK